ncbi:MULTISPECIES: LysR substrate-binding domain-containing protein [unclassified Variovorax]|jgi:LysR family nitrogen assimilation transcriptional regulator|uniref:LysR substrate-binding domain-containing protein n=1 Tax=unclassified Variovorax TaxID=663243 RepID=UPI0008CA68C0|nr:MULTISPECIES: LysR substrate-binding domain-containing protein [unclassified Variovorax]SEK10352.1 DNA-binding transcriptional regulator, LysR family [Variovorax sp. OK202]SFD67565.1 DNA-binding transcriptional regulator, LysR family [Variovorax sp. OK212]
MKLRQLSTFLLVADMQSLSRAAIASDTAQSLVSRQIAMLEAAWGGRLFDRTGRGMALSDFGKRMYPEVKRVVDQVAQLDAAASEAAGVLTGTVHVGVLPSLSRQLLPMLLADIRERAPALRLHVLEGFSGTLDEQLASGRLDMIVVNRYGSSALRGEDVLGKVDTFLIGKAGLPQFSGKTMPFRALAGLPLVLPAVPNGLRATLDVLARRHNVALDIVMEVDTATSMKDVAASGHAFTLLPNTAVAQEVAAGILGACKVTGPGIRRTIALSLTRQRPLSEGARLVASRVRLLASELLAG